MSKACVKLVRRQWVHGGVVIHHSPTSLWNGITARTPSTSSSPATTPRRTQIVHSQVDAIYRLENELYAVSTPPITTTTT
jgi:hypothetical protein